MVDLVGVRFIVGLGGVLASGFGDDCGVLLRFILSFDFALLVCCFDCCSVFNYCFDYWFSCYLSWVLVRLFWIFFALLFVCCFG